MDYFISVLAYLICTGFLVSEAADRAKRNAEDLSPGNWESCKPGATAPPTRVDTSGQIMLLRNYFATIGIDGYLIPSVDAHASEYVSDYDKRRAYISGFQGSQGFAVVTIYKQALWTDGRYFLEAEDTLDCNWILMRQREQGVPTMIEWIKTQLNASQNLGASPFLVNHADWKTYSDELKPYGIKMVPVYAELIDYFWTTGNGRPAQPSTPINVLPLQFAGRSWQDKVSDVRRSMEQKGVDMVVVTRLDETAWLFNLRANDIPFNPFFISYAIIEPNRIRLYLIDHLNKTTAEPTDPASLVTLAEHLNTGNTGSCEGRTGECVEIKEYSNENILMDVNESGNNLRRVLVSFSCSFAITSTLPKGNFVAGHTPIASAKVVKNEVEVQGMKTAHIRDAVALISFIAKLETEVQEGKQWTEVSAAQDLINYRTGQQYNRGLSFQSISGFGSNGAIIHYRPSNATNKQITTDGLYLLDSGGQYLDGTTDVTRTFHFGIPTNYQKECYTRVLKGHINLFQTIFPEGTYGRDIDAQARIPLWDIGLVYRHGTGHGIGMYLSVHEGPGRISDIRTSIDRDNPLEAFQFFSDGPIYFRASEELKEFNFISDEPGYYEDGEFGIRLENIVMVTNATTKYTFPGYRFLTFQHVTLVPYEPKLINFADLTEKQISYLNDYNKLCRDVIGPELKRQGQDAGYDWLIKNTEEIKLSNENQSSKQTSGAAFVSGTKGQMFCLVILLVVLMLDSLTN